MQYNNKDSILHYLFPGESWGFAHMFGFIQKTFCSGPVAFSMLRNEKSCTDVSGAKQQVLFLKPLLSKIVLALPPAETP